MVKSNIDFGPNLPFRTIDFGRKDYLELSTSGQPEVDGSKWFLGPKSMDPSDFRLRTTEVDAVHFDLAENLSEASAYNFFDSLFWQMKLDKLKNVGIIFVSKSNW